MMEDSDSVMNDGNRKQMNCRETQNAAKLMRLSLRDEEEDEVKKKMSADNDDSKTW